MNVPGEMVELACVGGDFADRVGMRRALEAALADVPDPYEAISGHVNADRRADAAEARARNAEATIAANQEVRWHLEARISMLEAGMRGVVAGMNVLLGEARQVEEP